VPSTQILSGGGFRVLASKCQVLLFCPQMCRVSRWTARFLLLVMLVPAFGPMAMAHAAQPESMHCMRQPLSAHSAQPAMPCHMAMAMPNSESELSFFGIKSDNCCQQQCCCGAITSEWAEPASSSPSFLSLLTEPAGSSPISEPQSSDIFGNDPARAPPRS
jgi:hypothetical protein